MKKITPLLVGMLLSLMLIGCENEETYPVFDSPVWVVSNENNINYHVNMTAIVCLPDNIASSAHEDDKLAAFAGDECRGAANLVDGKFFITIKGTPEDNSPIHFRYHSARTKYMYLTSDLFPFEVDTMYGSVDIPEKLPLTVIK